MCCSNIDCENIMGAFEEGEYDCVEDFIQKKLTRLTEFEDKLISFALQCGGQWDTANEEAKKWSNEFLSLAKKQLLSYADESNPAIEAMADLERVFECNPDKLPKWLKDDLGKKHLEGYIKGRNDTMREVSDFLHTHFNTASGTSTATLHGNTSATDGKEHNPSFID